MAHDNGLCEGYVKMGCCGDPDWTTFTTDEARASNPDWIFVSVPCDFISTTTTSTTTAFVPGTTTTTTTSTSTTSTSTTSTTSTTTTSTSTTTTTTTTLPPETIGLRLVNMTTFGNPLLVHWISMGKDPSDTSYYLTSAENMQGPGFTIAKSSVLFTGGTTKVSFGAFNSSYLAIGIYYSNNSGATYTHIQTVTVNDTNKHSVSFPTPFNFLGQEHMVELRFLAAE